MKIARAILRELPNAAVGIEILIILLFGSHAHRLSAHEQAQLEWSKVVLVVGAPVVKKPLALSTYTEVASLAR